MTEALKLIKFLTVILLISMVVVPSSALCETDAEPDHDIDDPSSITDREGIRELKDFLDLLEIEEVEEMEQQEITIFMKLQLEPVNTVINKYKHDNQEFIDFVEDRHLDRVSREQEEFLQKTQELELDLTVKHTYQEVINGFSVTLPPTQLEKLFSLSEITEVYPVGEVETQGHRVYPQLEIPRSWNLFHGGRLTGRGTTVAVLDTGVDFTHPDLGGDFGTGHKVVDGYDFVNRRNYPMDDEGHGTHVAGIIAADGQMTGIAPDANLLAYKVLDERGKGSTDNILAAIEEIVRDRRLGRRNAADVINLSFGASESHVGHVIGEALERAASQGISVVMAAGNKGPGESTLHFPDNFPQEGDKIINVGASGEGANQVRISASGISGSLTGELMLYSPAPDLDGPKEIIELGQASSYSDFTNWLGRSKVDEKIALVERGGANYQELANYADKAGAEAIIIYNDRSGIFYGSLVDPEDYIPVISLSRSDGNKLKKELSDGRVWTNLRTNSGIPSFSSRGPSSANTLKPDLVAPGAKVMSTWLYRDYSWAEGTSVSSAFVSGTAALLTQKNSKWGPDKIKSALMNSAESLTHSGGDEYSLTTQGAGELRTYEALIQNSIVTPASLSFGYIDLYQDTYQTSKSLTIHNNSNTSKSYSIDVKFDKGDRNASLSPSRSNVWISSDDSRSVNLELTADTQSLPFGEYYGEVVITDRQTGEETNVPFYFVKEVGDRFHTIDLQVEPFVVSDHVDGTINLRLLEPMEEVRLELYDDDQNKLDVLHSRSNIYTPRTLNYDWDGTKQDGTSLDSDFYFLDAYALPEGKDGDINANWLHTSHLVAVDREDPEIVIPNGDDRSIVHDSPYELKGRLLDLSFEMFKEGVDVFVNGNDVRVSENQFFSHYLELDPGVNSVTIEAVDWGENTSEKNIELFYDPDKLTLTVNGKDLEMDVPPILREERTLVPLRWLSEELGADVQYQNMEEPITVSHYTTDLQLSLGEEIIEVNEESRHIDVAPELLGGRTMVPVRMLVEELGGEVSWSSSDRTIHVSHQESKVSIDDELLSLVESPLVFGDRLLIPVRAFVDSQGGELEYVKDNRQVKVSMFGTDILIPISGKEIKVNGEIYRLAYPVFTLGDRLYVPGEVFELSFDWNLSRDPKDEKAFDFKKGGQREESEDD